MDNPMRDGSGHGPDSAVVAAGVVIAWRRWRLCPDESGQPRLGSAHEDHIWSAPTLRAECDPSRTWSYRLALDARQQHQAPMAGCRCGIHAYGTPELARPMGPGIWVHGRVLIGGPMFLTDNGYRGREATIDGPLRLTIECAGGDDLYSPMRCFGSPVRVKHAAKVYYPVCSEHLHAPAHTCVEGSFDIAGFLEAASVLAANLDTTIVGPAPV